MNLKSLVYWELSEGMTKQELASAVGVSKRTIADILADRLPKDPAIWEKFARYFHVDAEFMRTGKSAPIRTGFEVSSISRHSAAGQIRKVPLLNWHQIAQMIRSKDSPRTIQAETLLEVTDVPGVRTFALKVNDNSMQPLFSEGEIIFVNPDLPSKPGDYVVVQSQDGGPQGTLLRQVKQVGGQLILHPLNRQYEDVCLTKRQQIIGRVVRLRKNL